MTIMIQPDAESEIVSRLGLPPEHELGRPIAIDSLPIPREVRVEDGRVVWTISSTKCRRPVNGLLRDFLGLRAAEDRAVADFVRTWGPLRLCREKGHEAPWGHVVLGKKFYLCLPVLYRTDDRQRWVEIEKWSEPAEAYRRFARKAFGLLSCATILGRGSRPGSLDWGMALYGTEYSVSDETVRYPNRSLWLCIGSWLGSARPTVNITTYTGGGIGKLGLSACAPLFTALALQLAMAVRGSGGLGICAECGLPFERKRRPIPKHAEYCKKCGLKAAWRHAAQKWRQRQRTR